jgi:hypothetical protein
VTRSGAKRTGQSASVLQAFLGIFTPFPSRIGLAEVKPSYSEDDEHRDAGEFSEVHLEVIDRFDGRVILGIWW